MIQSLKLICFAALFCHDPPSGISVSNVFFSLIALVRQLYLSSCNFDQPTTKKFNQTP